jgi:hypothetical protein
VEQGNERSWKEAVVSDIVRDLPRNSFERRPYFPDLLNQPDLLIMPEIAKLIAVFIYTYHVSWASVLGSLEDLIEAKLQIGEHTVVGAFLGLKNDEPDRDTVEVLENTFDAFRVLNLEEDAVREGLLGTLEKADRKNVLNNFLSHEREQIRRSLSGFNETHYQVLVQKERAPEYEGREFEQSMLFRLKEVLHEADLIKEPHFPNVKGHVANLRQTYSFRFDFGIPGHPDVAIEVVRASRYGSRNKVRHLTMQGRLLRYQVDGNLLRPRVRDFRPILIVDGNLAGPDHDPYRYVRALISVGWRILRADQLEELPGLIRHADF